MDPSLQTTPQVEYSKIRELSPGTWALTEIKHSRDSVMVPVLSLQQMPEEDATRIVVVGGDSPGVYNTKGSDTPALVVPGPVDAKFDPYTMRSRNVPDLESSPAMLLAIDSSGLLLVCLYYVGTRPVSVYPTAVRVDTLEMVDVPRRCYWTDNFTLRLRNSRTDEWIDIPRPKE